MKSKKNRRILSVFLFCAGLLCLGLLVRILTVQPERRTPALIAAKPVIPNPPKVLPAAPSLDSMDIEDPPEVTGSEEQRSPASVEKRKHKKEDAFLIQQERKRFLKACLQFEKRSVGQWRGLQKDFPELRAIQVGTGKKNILQKDWAQLFKVIEEGVSERGIASTSEKSILKIKRLREKFIQRNQ